MKRSNVILLIMFFALVLLVIALFAVYWPVGVDYTYHYHRVAEHWLNGTTRLYDEPAVEFRNAPWMLPLLLPLTLFSMEIGQAILNVGSIVIVLASIAIWMQRKFRASPLVITMSVASLHMMDMLFRGQVDALVLPGIVLSWLGLQKRSPWLLSIGISIFLMKPHNLIILGVIILLAIRSWSWRDQLKVISLPLALIVVSGFFIGFDWPLRYLQFQRQSPPFEVLSITLWRGAMLTNLPVWPQIILGILAVAGILIVSYQTGFNQWVVAIATVTNFVFTIYANGNQYILLIPAFIYLGRINKRLAVLAYLFTWTPLLRLPLSDRVVWFDIGYPVVMLLALWGYKVHQANQLRKRDSMSFMMAFKAVMVNETKAEQESFSQQPVPQPVATPA